MDKLKNDDFTFTVSIMATPKRHGIVEESEQTDSEEKNLRQVEAASILEEVEHQSEEIKRKNSRNEKMKKEGIRN